MAEVSVVILSYNTRDVLERCLEHLIEGRRRVIVVDNASVDGSAELVGERFSDATLARLDTNRGFAVGANEGMRLAAPDDVVLLNPDAWPVNEALERLITCAAETPTAGLLGPRLVGVDGAPQPSFFGFPTRWWSGRPAVSSWPVPRDRASRSARRRFLSRRRPVRGFLVGAALFLRRDALEEVGGFDPAFFLFNEEIDLAWRMWEGGWTVELCPHATFVHVGGAATRRDWPAMYREQVRGHLRFLAKHQGLETAERARKFLRHALRARALTARGDRGRAYREVATWLASGHAGSLLRGPDRMPPDRTVEPEDRTTDSAR